MPATLAYAGACDHCHQALLLHSTQCACPNCHGIDYATRLLLAADLEIKPRVVSAWHKDCVRG